MVFLIVIRIEMKDYSQIKAFILKLIPDLKEETWGAFIDKVVVKNYKKGEVILKPGMVSNHVSFINSGLLRSYYLADGKEVITAFANEDSYYSDYESFLTRQPTIMYTDAIEDTEVVDISYDDLQSMYREHPQCERIGRLIAEDLFVFISARNNSFLSDTPEKRYLNFLSICEPIIQRIPQYMIASYIGVTPEALSRIRSRMSKKTLV